MSRKGKLDPDRQTAAPTPQQRGYLELWIKLSRLKWGTVALIPADPDGSTADMARTLASLGQNLSYDPVTAITLNSLEFGSALALADLQRHIEQGRRQEAIHGPVVDSTVATPGEAAKAGNTATATFTEALAKPMARLIISLPSLVDEPLGLAAAQESDLIVIAVRMGYTRTAHVQRTVELVGRERIAGCFLVR